MSWQTGEDCNVTPSTNHDILVELNLVQELLKISTFLFQSEGEDELKKRQLMELAIINGTYRDSQSKNSSRKFVYILLFSRQIVGSLVTEAAVTQHFFSRREN